MVKFIGRKYNGGGRGLEGRRNGGLLFTGHRVLALQGQRLGMDGSDRCTTGLMYLISLNCTLKNGQDRKFYTMCILQ